MARQLRSISGTRQGSVQRQADLDARPLSRDVEQLAPGTIVDLSPHITDFADTAAAIACMDLVISVDTAAAHLAGAMDKPVWTLLPFVPDWRWMLNRDDSPWYPTMRLFRQPGIGDWNTPIQEVTESLRNLTPTPETGQ